MGEQSLLRTIVGVVVALAIVFVTSRFFAKTYKPPEQLRADSKTVLPPGKSLIPLNCTVVVPDPMRKSGGQIPGLEEGAIPLSLLRPIGEMLSGFLTAAARQNFRDARFVSSALDVQESDILVELTDWRFADEHTGYKFTGLPLLLASGIAYTGLDVEVKVTGRVISPFTIIESVKGTRDLPIALFPFSRVERSMTESSDLAAEAVAMKIFERITANPEVQKAAGKKDDPTSSNDPARRPSQQQ